MLSEVTAKMKEVPADAKNLEPEMEGQQVSILSGDTTKASFTVHDADTDESTKNMIEVVSSVLKDKKRFSNEERKNMVVQLDKLHDMSREAVQFWAEHAQTYEDLAILLNDLANKSVMAGKHCRREQVESLVRTNHLGNVMTGAINMFQKKTTDIVLAAKSTEIETLEAKIAAKEAA